ncbi:MAG: hypothetical protein ACD_37C00224G0001 [uncultured bacterium]|uniref:Homing endonuclease LAGLIDADG domain-containing protein n=1 Tax=Candidatus Daviesbacteria bacterium RIFCSPHIGHO2_01_FULL_40_11 TaxID=1797762 RepID=A0A1F5JL36_9BACT|nr:MAG: hypothetical protein ACD_37C00224G0001 [uncultured bacterium]OGE29258.1 MAG: hypothetical protein A2867_05225 [Candidatus Daviesbacteria bacterium RIFCSPHIGHO2_01_FULL_40_11]OGE63162.1 MAG: hypothetical protein A2964_01010 [Candidatus Daviesbacteria bacterium RIFCSPLOWO2_01_FULL_40_27]
MININRIESADLWYVVGYIATDGYLSIDGRHINITSKDRDHLYKIRSALKLDNKIGRKSRVAHDEKRFSQLQFGDVKFYRFLKGLGLVSRKSLTLGPLNIDDKFFKDFFRGVIDGDGNISTWIHRTNHNRQWCLRIYSASKVFIEWLNNRVNQEFGIKGRLYSKKDKDRDNFIYLLKFGKLSALKILKRIYYDKSLFLERKFLQAQLCLQEGQKNGKLYT